MSDKPNCAPLCGASRAYGRFDRPWRHEPQCPVRVAWEVEKAATMEAGGAHCFVCGQALCVCMKAGDEQ